MPGRHGDRDGPVGRLAAARSDIALRPRGCYKTNGLNRTISILILLGLLPTTGSAGRLWLECQQGQSRQVVPFFIDCCDEKQPPAAPPQQSQDCTDCVDKPVVLDTPPRPSQSRPLDLTAWADCTWLMPMEVLRASAAYAPGVESADSALAQLAGVFLRC